MSTGHEAGFGEGTSPEDSPFYLSICSDLIRGKSVLALLATKPNGDDDKPEIILFRHTETSAKRIMAASYPVPRVRAINAITAHIIARQRAEQHGYKPVVA